MGNYALMIISLFASALGTVTRKYFTDKSGSGIASKCIYTAASCLVAALCLAAVGDMMKPSAFTALLSILFGTITALQGIAMLTAMRLGPVSYTMMFSSFSTVITALSGVLFFNESITPLKIFGILLMLVSFVFAVERSKDNKKGNFAWLMLCIAVFLGTGGIGLMQKVYQTSEYKNELDIFLVLAFIVCAAVASLASAILSHTKEKKNPLFPEIDKKQAVFLILFTLGGGVCVAINNKLNLFLSGVLDTSVFFPIANGGAVVLSTLFAFFFFKERLSLRRWIGLFIGVLAVVLLCI